MNIFNTLATCRCGSSSGVVVKLLASPLAEKEVWGFDSQSRRYDFRNWLSPLSKSPYRCNIAKAT